KVFIRLLAKRQDVDRVFDGHGTELLQFPPYTDTQVGRFRWQLMNKQEPVLNVRGSHISHCNKNMIVTTVTLQRGSNVVSTELRGEFFNPQQAPFQPRAQVTPSEAC